MKLTNNQLRKVIREETARLLKEERIKTLKEQHNTPGDAIAAAEKGLAAIMLEKVFAGQFAEEIYQYMYDIGFEDHDTMAALDQLRDRYNL